MSNYCYTHLGERQIILYNDKKHIIMYTIRKCAIMYNAKYIFF